MSLQSEEEGIKVKQGETAEAVQLAEQRGPANVDAAPGLVVPVQNGEGDSLHLSAGFIQVMPPCLSSCGLHVFLRHVM